MVALILFKCEQWHSHTLSLRWQHRAATAAAAAAAAGAGGAGGGGVIVIFDTSYTHDAALHRVAKVSSSKTSNDYGWNTASSDVSVWCLFCLFSSFFVLLSSFPCLSPSPFFSHCLLNIGGQQVPSRSNEQARCRYLSCVGSRNGCCRRCLVLQNITGWSLFFSFSFLFSLSLFLLPPQMFNCAKHIQLILHTLILLFFLFLLLLFNIQKNTLPHSSTTCSCPVSLRCWFSSS